MEMKHMDNSHIHPNLTKDLAAISQLVVTQWLSDMFDQDEEAGRLACDMVGQGLAHLEMRTEFLRDVAPVHRLLMLPADGNGEPVEIAVLGCQPVEPTPEGVAARMWFFGRLSHWQPKH
jgi:hypothetical protein